MARFAQGDVVRLKSNNSIEGAVINVLEGSGEIRYQVFTGTMGIQTYYESQLVSKEIKSTLEQVDSARFNAGLTASLIRNPSLSSLYSLNSARIDFIPHQFRPVLKFIKSDRPRLLIADGDAAIGYIHQRSIMGYSLWYDLQGLICQFLNLLIG